MTLRKKYPCQLKFDNGVNQTNVYNPPSRRLHHRRHHQQNFMIAHFQMHYNGDGHPF